ncbi:hypothetical protein GGD81_004550 [Rhodobium orientis]|nr:hypothetical protein [Rhodobium orientis]MBB4305471.1 hypothetical protein [Rhodobium orientis]
MTHRPFRKDIEMDAALRRGRALRSRAFHDLPRDLRALVRSIFERDGRRRDGVACGLERDRRQPRKIVPTDGSA